MNFSSLSFLLFITAFTALFLALARTRAFTPMLLASSYVFYSWWDYRFCLLLAFTTAIDYWCGLKVGGAANRDEARRYMLLSVASNLAILFFFKYFNFFIDSAQTALASLGIDAGHTALSIILPVGISFYTFQNLSYTLDVYKGELKPERSLLNYATFVAFFPQLVAGPIVRARELLPQIARPPEKVDFAFRFNGLEKIVWGYFLKLVLADNAAAVVDARFAQPEFYNALNHIIGMVCFSLQIYGDFAGYSLIAIGLAQVYGYRLPANFGRPYFATGFGDFWRRWHISLSSWFRDYLYIPLGGNRTYALRLRNVAITMLVSGLWHGASWTFILWGAMHAGLVLAEDAGRRVARFFGLGLPGWSRLLRPVAIVLVFAAITLTWLPFRADGMDTVRTILAIIAQGDFSLPHGMQQTTALLRVAIAALVVFSIDALIEGGMTRRYTGAPVLVRSFACSSLIVLLLLVGSFGNRSFIYFQF